VAFEDLFIRIRAKSPFTSDHIIDRTWLDMPQVGLATRWFPGLFFTKACFSRSHEAHEGHEESNVTTKNAENAEFAEVRRRSRRNAAA
jgi:hypothetical protein